MLVSPARNQISSWTTNQLMHDRFLMQLLCRDHRKALGEVKAHLIPKHAARAGTRTIHTVNTVIHNMRKKVEMSIPLSIT